MFFPILISLGCEDINIKKIQKWYSHWVHHGFCFFVFMPLILKGVSAHSF